MLRAHRACVSTRSNSNKRAVNATGAYHMEYSHRFAPMARRSTHSSIMAEISGKSDSLSIYGPYLIMDIKKLMK